MFGLGFNRGGWHGMMDGWQAWPSWSHYTTTYFKMLNFQHQKEKKTKNCEK